MRELRSALRLLGTGVGLAFWCIGTTCLGIRAMWKVGVLCVRWRQVTAEVRYCARGHAVSQYGLWECACGSRIEGWAFAPCEICHESAAYVPCGVCGLPVKNPLLL